MRRHAALVVVVLVLSAACDKAGAPPPTQVGFEELITAWAERGEEPRVGLSAAFDPFRTGDVTPLVIGWDRLVRPTVPTTRPVQFLALVSQLDSARVVSFVAEHIEDLEHRYEGRPADRLAILKAVNEWTNKGPAPAIPARHVLAVHRAKAIEELWLAKPPTPESSLGFVRDTAVQFMRFTSQPDSTDPVGRAELADLLVRHAAVLAPRVREEMLAHPTDEGPLEESLNNAIVQCLFTDRLAQLDHAYGTMLAEGVTLRLDAAPHTVVGLSTALARGNPTLSALERLSHDPVVTESVAAKEAFWKALGDGDLAETARVLLQAELDDVKSERESVRCVAGKVLGTRGAEEHEPAPRVAYRTRDYPGFFEQRRPSHPAAEQFAPRRMPLRPTPGVVLEVQLAPCRRKDLRPPTEAGRRVLVVRAEMLPYGKSVELAVAPMGKVTRTNADQQLETWDQFAEKDVTQLDALERSLTKDVAVALATRKKSDVAVEAVEPRLRAAFEALEHRQP